MEKFIASVHSRPCLWDQRVSDFHNKSLVRKMWAIVERECDLEGTAFKKWKNLKDTFRREHRKLSSKWAHYTDLLFLKDVMTARIPADNLTADNEINTTEYKIIFERDNNTDSRESNNLQQQSYERKQKRHRNRNHDSVSERVEDNSKKSKTKTTERKSVSIAADDDKTDDDDDYHFLMSFRAYLKQMSDQKKLKFRIKMQELVYDIMYANEVGETRNSSTYFPGYTSMMNSSKDNAGNMHDMQGTNMLEFEDIKPVISD